MEQMDSMPRTLALTLMAGVLFGSAFWAGLAAVLVR